jgi:hypothetical protein
MSVAGVAIINKDNIPLLLRTRSDLEEEGVGIGDGHVKGLPGHVQDREEGVKLLYLLHSSLDMVEEKQAQTQNREVYLGLLNQCENYKIFGLLSTTRVKVILMVSTTSNVMLRDNEARNMLKQLHGSYIEATTNNPFYTPGDTIRSKNLDATVRSIFSN